MFAYRVAARRIDGHGSEARAKAVQIMLDTDIAGHNNAFNPAEMLLARLAACVLKGAQRVVPMLKVELSGIEISLHGPGRIARPKWSFSTMGLLLVQTGLISGSPCCTVTCGHTARSPTLRLR